MKIQVKKLRPGAKLPTRGSENAAGYDLYACLDAETADIPPHGTFRVGTGLSVAIPDGYFGAIFARSGLAAKQGLRPANCVGVADADYRGEYLVVLRNDSDAVRTIRDGDRIAQLVVLPFLPAEFEETETLEDTSRGDGGFGSTGR